MYASSLAAVKEGGREREGEREGGEGREREGGREGEGRESRGRGRRATSVHSKHSKKCMWCTDC